MKYLFIFASFRIIPLNRRKIEYQSQIDINEQMRQKILYSFLFVYSLRLPNKFFIKESKDQ